MNLKFNITGLDCANCAAELERSISKIEGISSVNINFLTEKMEIELSTDNQETVIKQMKKVIKKEEPDVEVEEI